MLDASSTTVHVGLLQTDAPAIWRSSEQEAGTALFELVDACLQSTAQGMEQVAAFVYCSGPGSMLGVRTVAMAIRTWQALSPRPAYAYLSLPLLANELDRLGTPAPFTVIADARRDTWHGVRVTAPRAVGALQRIPSPELAASTETLFQPAAFRAWAAAPRAMQPCSYVVPDLLAQHGEVPLFTAVEFPDAFQHEAPEYKKWSAQVHSAATADRK